MFVKRILVAGVLVAAGVLILFHKSTRRFRENTKLTSLIPEKVRIKDEAFRFKKSLRVKFEFNEKVFGQNFEGLFFLRWVERDVAFASVKLEGYLSHLFIKARFDEKFSLKCVEIPKVSKEADFDQLLLIKSLLLDYAFRTSRDDNGNYEVTFHQENSSNSDQRISKVKLRYLNSSKQGIKVVTSRHKILLNPSLSQIIGNEHLEVSFKGSRHAFVKSSYELNAIKGVSFPNRKGNLNFGQCGDFDINDFKIAQTLDGDNFKAHLAEIKSTSRSKRHDQLRSTLKILKSKPELISTFMNWFATVKGDKNISALAIGVLGQLGTEEAQKNLVNIFHEAAGENTHLHVQVLNTFTLTTKPLTQESRAFLKNIIHESKTDLVFGAAYALGASIQNDPEGIEVRNDLDFLVSELENAENVENKLVFLDALGNTKSKEALPSLKKYASSNDKLVREKASQVVKNFNEGSNVP
jgi:hypothetical protein